MNNALRFALCLGLCSVSSWARAQSTELTPRSAVQRTIEENPTVHAAMSDLRQSMADLRAEENRYRPRLLIEAYGTHQETPNLNILGGTSTQQSEALSIGAELSQTFAFGTTLALRLENYNSRSEGPLFSGSGESYRLGPGNLFGARLSVTQPLLRGFGTDVGLAELRQSQLRRKEQDRARDATASETLSATLQAYWELWYAQKALEIEQQARSLAAQQLQDTRRRVAAGGKAEVDVLTYETRLAELDQNVLDAEVNVRTRSIELAKALGLTQAHSFDVSQATPPAVEPVDSQTMLKEAEAASYTVAQLRIALEQSQSSLRSAADATRPRLDVSAWVQTQGLGNRSVGDAFDQIGRFTNISANVGVTLELPVSSERHEAQRASASMAVQAAQERLAAGLQQVRANTASELTALEQAAQKIDLAQRTAGLASRSAEAQQKRLQNGVAIPLEVREAEDTLRRARLSVERHRVDAIKTQIRLDHLTGRLLAAWGLSLDSEG